MKRILILLFTAIFIMPAFCSCSEKSSDIGADSFEKNIINRISAEKKFKKSNGDNSVTYTRENLEYALETSDDGYIKTLTVTVKGTDNEYLRKLNYNMVINPVADLTKQQLESIHAVRYSAMALTLICDLQDEDSIDSVLDARTREISEEGWKLSFDNGKDKIVFRAIYE